MGHVSDLLRQAQSQTGLIEFGETSFREGLEILVTAVDREAALTQAGGAAINTLIVELLCNRPQIEDWYHRHPDIDDQEIVAPLIGLGLPSHSKSRATSARCRRSLGSTLRNCGEALSFIQIALT